MPATRLSLRLGCSAVIGFLLFSDARAVPPRGALTADGRPAQPEATAPLALDRSSDLGGTAAAGFNASGINLLSHIPIEDFGGDSNGANDCWGYVSPSGREYALIGNSRGLGIAEVTNPTAPVVIGEIPHSPSGWSDMKAFDEYVYVVNESGGGLQVLDMTLVDAGVVAVAPANPRQFNTAHNIALNPDSGFTYPCSTNSVTGFIAYDLSNPADPQTASGWFWNERNVHDLHLLSYDDCPYAGRSGPCEIAFALCGGAGLFVIDVTDKANMTTIASRTYPTLRFAHQGWTTEDRKYLLTDDESDELSLGLPSTTYVWNIEDLANPALVATHTNGQSSIDHNLYIRGDYQFSANYTSGLRVFDISDPLNGFEAGFFDTSVFSSVSFAGAWGTYPLLPSGVVLVSDMENGLFVLDVTPTTGCFTDENCDDSNDCTIDTCLPGGACSYADAGAGSACEDGDNCTINGLCDGLGNCDSTPVSTVSCDDNGDCGLFACGGNGFCECVPCVSVSPPVVTEPDLPRNRFLTITPGSPGETTALEVVFGSLAPPHDIYNGMRMWVGAPRNVSAAGGTAEENPTGPNIRVATLTCEPHFADWGSLGTVSLTHPVIRPDSQYFVRAISEGCVISQVDQFSSPAPVATGPFGDLISDLSNLPPGPPDGDVAIADVMAVIWSFAGVTGVDKTRTDLEPAEVDLIINVSDVLVDLTAFAGVGYPFAPPPGPPPCP